MRVTTDAGLGFLKALGNHGGPHLMAADLLGTQCAAWLGLPTFEWAIVDVTPEDEITFLRGGQAQPGPAFMLIACAAMLALWLLRVTPSWVRLAADAYALRLLAACDQLTTQPEQRNAPRLIIPA